MAVAKLVSLPVGFRVGPTPHDSPARPLYLRLAHPVPTRERKTNHVANIKSQIKRNRTNLKAQERNKAVKTEVKSAVRATREAVASGDKDKATAALRVATRKLDKAAGKGVIHKNQAANRKSAIAKQVAAL
jgi:small subunit ribosomal protein S20